MINETLQIKLKLLTESPGCYLMKSQGEIIYVGKAKNLKNRVKSYFVQNAQHSAKVQAMVNKVDDFELILCNSNFEALTLECNLIKKHRPFYNILLKDDKNYPYIKINKAQIFPKIELARKKDNSNAEFFGPYLGTSVIKELTGELAKIFPLRTCHLKFPLQKPIRPCMRYELNLCLAPCANFCSKEEYADVVDQTVSFLKGNTDLVLLSLKEKMLKYSEKLEFEKAALYRDKIEKLQQIKNKQVSIQNTKLSQDVWALASNAKDACLYRLIIADGKILGGKSYFVNDIQQENLNELFTIFLPQVYSTSFSIPQEVIIDSNTDDNTSLLKWLNEEAKRKVKLIVPQKGKKHELVLIAQKNALEQLNKHTLIQKLKNDKTIGACSSLADNLNLIEAPHRIEGYDISNTMGTHSVASMVVFVNGKPHKKAYRKFKIQTVEGANDIASIEEVLYRRFKHGLEDREHCIQNNIPFHESSFGEFPDLILIDGGPLQLQSALNALYALDIHCPICSLAEKNEEIYIPNRALPIILDGHDPALHLVQSIRDESHRFAITFHRTLRDKAMVKSQLLSIPGIGSQKAKLLLDHFKLYKNIQAASFEELLQVKGITPTLANNILKFFDALQSTENKS
ncbi:MAG: excinuclease ABC subunit UvrC [Eubacteriales bacterium]|nr:excinuclease ABC subunit UvrC [Eubacteriales bacterium]